MTDELIKDVMLTWGVDRETAISWLHRGNEAASVAGDGTPLDALPTAYRHSHEASAAENQMPDQKQTRRAVLRYSIIGGIVGGIASQAAGNLLADGLKTLANWFSDAGIDRSLDPYIINLIARERSNSNLVALLPETASQDARMLAQAIVGFAAGYPIGADAYLGILKLARHSREPESRLLATDLVTSELIRGGASTWARKIFDDLIDIDAISNGRDDMLVYCDKQFNLCYTLLSPQNALRPRSWGFEKPLAVVAKFDLSNQGITVAEDPLGYRVDYRGGFIVDAEVISMGIKGFYTINWILLYWAASLRPEDSKICAKAQLDVLKQYLAYPEFQRSGWNMAYIIGLFYHRRSMATDNQGDCKTVRNWFFDVCLNQREGFPTEFGRLSEGSINANDVVAISMALMLQTDPDLKQYHHPNVAGLRFLAQLAGAVRPISIHRCMDQIRRASGESVVPWHVPKLYFGDDQTHSIYLPDDKLVFAAAS